MTTPKTSELQRMSVADIAAAASDGPLPFRVTAFDGSSTGDPSSGIGLHVRSERALRYLFYAPGDLGLARAYVSRELDFIGVHPADPYELLKLIDDEYSVRRPSLRELTRIAAAAGWRSLRPLAPPPQEAEPRWLRMRHGLPHSKRRDSSAVSRHYDVSNRFYEYVLGPSMIYTCALYRAPSTTLEDAQEAKCALVFDKLGLQPGDRLLDVGSGWGSMVRHAARRGVRVIGATLSRPQAEWAQKAIVNEGLHHLAEVRHLDYRDVPESGFDAISSIGLTEHIGVKNYPAYFASLREKLRPGGRLLNHCITRPNTRMSRFPEAFIERYVFPDGELAAVGRIISEIQDAGFDVRHEENIREHYASTLRDWCANLREHWDECVDEVGEASARVWGLYMAGSRLGFERNQIQLHQVLAVKPTAKGDAQVPRRPWWRG